jgi:hypothetical protein
MGLAFPRINHRDPPQGKDMPTMDRREFLKISANQWGGCN